MYNKYFFFNLYLSVLHKNMLSVLLNIFKICVEYTLKGASHNDSWNYGRYSSNIFHCVKYITVL